MCLHHTQVTFQHMPVEVTRRMKSLQTKSASSAYSINLSAYFCTVSQLVCVSRNLWSQEQFILTIFKNPLWICLYYFSTHLLNEGVYNFLKSNPQVCNSIFTYKLHCSFRVKWRMDDAAYPLGFSKQPGDPVFKERGWADCDGKLSMALYM